MESGFESESHDFGIFGVLLFLWPEKDHRKSRGHSCSFQGQVWGWGTGRHSEASLDSVVKLPKESRGVERRKGESWKV